MILKNKIKKLIDLIENTQIEEIEVSSFWGAQKIKLSKSKSSQKVIIPDQIHSLKSKDQKTELDDNKIIEKKSTEQKIFIMIQINILEKS